MTSQLTFSSAAAAAAAAGRRVNTGVRHCHSVTPLLGGLQSALACTSTSPQSLDNILGCKGSVKVIQHTSMVAIEERVFSKQLHFYSCESQLAWSQNINLKLHYKSILRTTLSFV